MSGDLFSYDGKHVLVVGGATGMGAAAAQLVKGQGARVTVMDVAEIGYDADQTIKVDLRDRASVDDAIGQIDGKVDAVFSCAGVADGTPGIMLINFTSQRYLLETLVANGQIAKGGSIAMISSVAGLGWERNPQVNEYLATTDWDSAAAWVEAHPDTDNYTFSKQVMSAYVARQGFPLLKQGIRINAIQPGPTDTPLARANADIWLTFGQDYRDAAGVKHLTPEEMAATLIFLCSDAASGVNGLNMLVDHGHVWAGATGAFDAPTGAMVGME